MQIWKDNGDFSRHVSLGEGQTPLVKSISRTMPMGGRLWFKLESCNSAGSYKDRFVAAEVELMLKNSVRAWMATSSGNTGSSLATYSARYGLKCVVMLNQDAPSSKMTQMQAHGAQVVRIPDINSVTSTTQISGLSVPTDIDASRGLGLIRLCNDTGITLNDAEVFSAQRALVVQEGRVL